MTGQTISHYRILGKLGEGGMGVVYKARDITLERDVALKFLPARIAASPSDRQRFIQEARSAASLNHPNICTIHGVEEAGEHLFIVMELVDGRTLRSAITDGHLNSGERLAIGIQIGEALSEAHKADIVHRDIKSENIMLNARGQAKILDFGLAKLKGALKLTKTSSTVGTVAYMAPEQIQGGLVDARSDIFSFGVVLFELFTGRLPFRGEHEAAMMYSVLNEEPQRLTSVDPGANPGVEEIILRALRKEPAERQQSVDEIISGLRAVREETRPPSGARRAVVRPIRGRRRLVIVGGVTAVLLSAAALVEFVHPFSARGTGASGNAEIHRLAVLPFSNLRHDPENDFLGFALADQIIGNLSYVSHLLVRPSMAVRAYHDQAVDAATAARALNVDYILSGTYQREADVVRLSVELIDVRTNDMVWRNAYEEPWVNAFKLEDAVSRKVTDGLRIQLTTPQQAAVHADVPADPQAYELYLRGVASDVTTEGDRRAVDLFRRSIALDSTFAPAYSALGYRYHQLADYTNGQHDLLLEVERVEGRALALNPNLLSAIAELTALYTDIGRTEDAIRMARRALTIVPDDPGSLFFLGYAYRYAGLLDEAVRVQEQAVRLDPNPHFRSLAVTYISMNRFDDALRALELDSTSNFTLFHRSDIALRQHRNADARQTLDRLLAIESTGIFAELAQFYKAYIRRDTERMAAIIRSWNGRPFVDGEQSYGIASCIALAGDARGAAEAIQSAVDHGFFCYPMMQTDLFLDPVRSDPAVHAALEHARSKYESFQRIVKTLGTD